MSSLVIFEFVKSRRRYPVCIAGEQACPPDDCGGPYGYEDLLKILNDPEHEDYKYVKRWIGKDFDADKIRFENPEIRWRNAFLN